MNNLERITFHSQNSFIVDNKHQVKVKINENKKKYCFDGKQFDNEKLLFDYIEEMTTTGSVGGGYEMPLKYYKKMPKKVILPYTTIVEKLVKAALISEFVNKHPHFSYIEAYKKINGENADDNMSKVQDNINIVYSQILNQAPERDYYQDNNDYNGDGILNPFKTNDTNLDLVYDNVSLEFQERVADEMAKTEIGQKMMDMAQKKAELRQDNPYAKGMVQLGNDIEFPKYDAKDRKNFVRNRVAMLGFKNEEKTIRYNFNETVFENTTIVENKIPSNAKKDGNVFQMIDKQKNLYEILWESDKPIILNYKNLVSEQREQQKIKNILNIK